jgi:hypothetical protein
MPSSSRARRLRASSSVFLGTAKTKLPRLDDDSQHGASSAPAGPRGPVTATPEIHRRWRSHEDGCQPGSVRSEPPRECAVQSARRVGNLQAFIAAQLKLETLLHRKHARTSIDHRIAFWQFKKQFRF